jgi:hypothetical protein
MTMGYKTLSQTLLWAAIKISHTQLPQMIGYCCFSNVSPQGLLSLAALPGWGSYIG